MGKVTLEPYDFDVGDRVDVTLSVKDLNFIPRGPLGGRRRMGYGGSFETTTAIVEGRRRREGRNCYKVRITKSIRSIADDYKRGQKVEVDGMFVHKRGWLEKEDSQDKTKVSQTKYARKNN